MRYRILNPEISYPTDASIIARLLAGDDIPIEDRGIVRRTAGEIVDDIPEVSVAGLLADGDIEIVVDTPQVIEEDKKDEAV